jgi:hypothetical protein
MLFSTLLGVGVTISELCMSIIIILADSFILRRPGLQVRAPKGCFFCCTCTPAERYVKLFLVDVWLNL